MSLFHLFSKPKVERQRGYAEPSFSARPPLSTKASATSKSDLSVQAQRSDAAAPPARAPSVLSGRSNRSNPAKPLHVPLKRPEARPLPRDRKTHSFDPPPLFQAFPQSVKDGKLETSQLSPDPAQKPNRWKSASSAPPATTGLPTDGLEERTSTDIGRDGLPTIKHGAQGSTGQNEVARKIFVLVTSGYLLQYAETGASDRLPEKMLHLGKDSAAFACDLVPGKHFVLRVSQAVDQHGTPMVSSTSILSRFGIRSSAAKRATANLLLVMPDAAEMESWMTAIRQEIERLGGKKILPDPGLRSKSQDPPNTVSGVKKTPSQSHRYQVRRDPSRISNVSSPLHTPQEEVLSFALPPPKPDDGKSLSGRSETAKSETATIDCIEAEASRLVDEGILPDARSRSPSDSPSLTSSAATSVEQQQLNMLRNSVVLSARISSASATGTVATTVTNPSRTNSLTDSPPSETSNTRSPDIPTDHAQGSMAHRKLASYGPNRRRSALPKTREDPISPITAPSPTNNRYSSILEPPVMRTSQRPPSMSPTKRLTCAYSEPDLQSLANVNMREIQNVKMPNPPILEKNAARPESFIGDLPPPSTWSAAKSSNRRLPNIQTTVMPAPASPTSVNPNSPRASVYPTHGILKQTSPVTASSPQGVQEPPPFRRLSSFSMPLRINPSTVQNQHAPGLNNRRASKLSDPDPAAERPQVHTLTAKVEPKPVKRFSLSPTPTASPVSETPPSIPSRTSSAHFSVGGDAISPTSQQPDATNCFPSPPSQSTQAQSQINARALRRPTSLQVRTDHAPFLSSVRNSTIVTPSARTLAVPPGPAPIRGLKPSRSAANVSAVAHSPTSPVEALRVLQFDVKPTLESSSSSSNAATDNVATPLTAPVPAPAIAFSAVPSNRTSRIAVPRGFPIRPRSSLPELDFGIPVIGLGPPAPPPSAPLPAPPSLRAASPPPAATSAATGIDAIAGLGINVR